MMKTVWTNGLSTQQKEEMRADFLSAGRLRERGIEIARKKIETARKSSILKDSYESPNWALLQADSCGYIRALEEIISILD